jgi:hypothetical protein
MNKARVYGAIAIAIYSNQIATTKKHLTVQHYLFFDRSLIFLCIFLVLSCDSFSMSMNDAPLQAL